jgi:hypothetical protein
MCDKVALFSVPVVELSQNQRSYSDLHTNNALRKASG